MTDFQPIISDDVSPLLASLDQRDVALWVRQPDCDDSETASLTSLIRLPWRLVVLETSSKSLVSSIDETTSNDPLVHARGFPMLVSGDPTQIDLPQRCLPIYLLDGTPGQVADSFQNQLRRINMLGELRRSEVRRIFVLCAPEAALPSEVHDLCHGDFRPIISICSHDALSKAELADYRALRLPTTIYDFSISSLTDHLTELYHQHYGPERSVIKLRQSTLGEFTSLDVSDMDDPERPVLSGFAAIKEADLATLLPDELTKDEFISFFRDPSSSWRPYAAGLPWDRSGHALQSLLAILQRLEVQGSTEGTLATIAAEPGSGATTFVRQLAWHCASKGYPVLVSQQTLTVPDSLKMSNFLNRVRRLAASDPESSYEVPWVIVFDRPHWETDDLARFLRDLRRDGRPVCIMAVTGTRRRLPMPDALPEEELATLTHIVEKQEALELGQHLDRFLRPHGLTRPLTEWERFHQQHKVGVDVSHFWIALSFWIQGHYDLTETIQERIYRSFKDHASNLGLKQAILDIAALSAQGIRTPDRVLSTPSDSDWPVSHLLEDALADLAYMGLLKFQTDGERYWCIVHDILGQQLLNALFQDFSMRKSMGLEDAQEGVHLQLLILQRIAQRSELGERALRNLGEQFAMTVFKVDPDDGRAVFARYWRDVIAALEAMPASLRDGSRVFRHHAAISRRRIAKLDGPFFNVSSADREQLLQDAISDVEYALTAIPYERGGESDLNLYNSLAHAYFDLAEELAQKEDKEHLVATLRNKGNEAAQRVFEEDPTNSFTIVTYVRNLFARAALDPSQEIDLVIKILGILFSALASRERVYRVGRLESLARQAVETLFRDSGGGEARAARVPRNAVDVLYNAWAILTEDAHVDEAVVFEALPKEKLEHAQAVLEDPAGKGNVQVVRLRYEIMCILYPSNFAKQIELIEELQGPGALPQLRLEYAVLLYQNSRPVEGNEEFFRLRQLWRERDYVVQVPERLRWLLDEVGGARTVRATVISNDFGRPMAAVREFGNKRAPFRPEEFGQRSAHAGWRFAGAVTFGHNGPLLRPVNAIPRALARASV